MTDSPEQTAEKIAGRGREALISRLRPAFEEAAAAHSDVLKLGPEQIEEMVQRAADRADGLQWRRALAHVATEELGISLGEALSHPAVSRAHEIVGAPSYEDSLAELGPIGVRPPAGSAAAGIGAPAAAEPTAPEGTEAAEEPEAPEDELGASEHEDGVGAEAPADTEGEAPETAAEPDDAEGEHAEAEGAEAEDAQGEDAEREAPEAATAEGDGPRPEQESAIGAADGLDGEADADEDEPGFASDLAPLGEAQPLGQVRPDEAAQPLGQVQPDEAAQPLEDFQPGGDAHALGEPEPDLGEPEPGIEEAGSIPTPGDATAEYSFEDFDDDLYDDDGLRIAVIHLGGIANLEPAEGDIELLMSADGLDIIRGGNDVLGRLEWDQVKALEVPLPRSRRRMRRPSPTHLVIRTARGDASFEVPDVTAAELRQHLAPVIDDHIRRA